MLTLMPPGGSDRDEQILRDLASVRLLTGRQIERLHFAHLATDAARGSGRRRTMARLVALKLVTTLPRQVGGARAGSAGLVYTLDAPGHRLLAGADLPPGRLRRPWSIGWLFVQHTLDVAELYVRLREQERAGALQLRYFVTEPACWFDTGRLVLKPDAFVLLMTPRWEEHYWVEVDRATESLPTLRRKLLTYVDFANAGTAGPAGLVPQVLVTVPTVARQTDGEQLVADLPEPAARLIRFCQFDNVFSPGRPPP